MSESGLVDKETFQDKLHPRFFGGLPRMPWKRKFYCEYCEKEIVGLANVDQIDDMLVHRFQRDNVRGFEIHPVEEVE